MLKFNIKMNQAFVDLYQLIWKEVFPEEPALEIGEFERIMAEDIFLPKKYKCALSGKPVYSSPEYGYKKFISPEAWIEKGQGGNVMEEKAEIKDLSDLLVRIDKIALFKANRSLNSDVIEASDDIHSSNLIYKSAHIYVCQKLLFCHNMVESEYVMASMGSKSCNFSIRALDSAKVSNSFDVSYCANVAHSYFCHNCFDLRDCMFCFHLASKQYCVGNAQYEEAEYKKIKEKLLKEYFENLKKDGAFVSLETMK